MANKKTTKKLNRRPQVGDIIRFSNDPRDRNHYLVLKFRETPLTYMLHCLDDGTVLWYDYAFWLRKWRKVV